MSDVLKNHPALAAGLAEEWRQKDRCIAELEAQREFWKEEARRYCENADHWRTKAKHRKELLKETEVQLAKSREALLELAHQLENYPGLDTHVFDILYPITQRGLPPEPR